MSPFVEGVRSIRWVAVPLLAYLLVTLALPAANGAAARPGFAYHALWVIAGCVAAVAVVLAVDLVRRRSR